MERFLKVVDQISSNIKFQFYICIGPPAGLSADDLAFTFSKGRPLSQAIEYFQNLEHDKAQSRSKYDYAGDRGPRGRMAPRKKHVPDESNASGNVFGAVTVPGSGDWELKKRQAEIQSKYTLGAQKDNSGKDAGVEGPDRLRIG